MFTTDKWYASLDEALAGINFEDEIRELLVLITLPYYSFDGVVREGQMVVHNKLAFELRNIFGKICQLKFPIERMVPVEQYGWDDTASMLANNTSCFNYRMMDSGRRLSYHSHGIAVDINPRLNPSFELDGQVKPPGALYNPTVPGTLRADREIVDIFKKRRWAWGGNWTDPVDYQHFQKTALRPDA